MKLREFIDKLNEIPEAFHELDIEILDSDGTVIEIDSSNIVEFDEDSDKLYILCKNLY